MNRSSHHLPPIPNRIVAAGEMFSDVIKLAPEFAGGYAGVSMMTSFINIWINAHDANAVAEAIQLAEKACSVDDSSGWSHVALGVALLSKGNHADSIEAIKRGIACEPNDAQAWGMLSLSQSLAGEYEEALVAIDQSTRLNPSFIYGPYLNIRGIGHYLAGKLESAVESFQENENLKGPVGPPALSFQAAALYELGRLDEMNLRVEQVKRDFPGFSLAGWAFPGLVRDADTRDLMLARMRKAGIPSS